MEIRSKLAILADAAKYDASCASSGAPKRGAAANGIGSTSNGICHAYTPDGRCVSLLKILLTNYCLFDCAYCVNRRSSNVPRAAFAVDEVVRLTLAFYKRNYIEGLFLSSGIVKSPDYTMEQLVAVARTLREVHAYNGYIHLKAVPGASEELIAAAGRWADRLSANIELPTQGDLDRLAPEKQRATIETTMTQIRERRDEAEAEPSAPRFAPAGQGTQMVVGASDSPDATILETASDLYSRHRLRRVYYTAFSPFPKADSRLPVQPAPLIREHRLYQADWLLRFYGFEAGELTTAEEPNLDLAIDPKLAWALRHREFFPVDVNRAAKSKLLRVPGLGARNVERILKARRFGRLSLSDLAKLKVRLGKAQPFVLTSDHNPDALLIDRQDLRSRIAVRQEQLLLFPSPAESARSGEL
jgi:putative DNA modification/repair radical SAM protein